MVTISLTEDKCGQTIFKSLLWDPKPHLGHSYRFRVLRSQRKLRGTHWWRRSTPQAGFKQSHSAFYRAWVLLQPLGDKTLIAFFFPCGSLRGSVWLGGRTTLVPEGHEMWLRSQLLFARMAISLSSFRNCSCHLLPLDVPASFWKVGNSSSIISLLEGQMGFESQQTAPCLLNKNQEKLERKKQNN